MRNQAYLEPTDAQIDAARRRRAEQLATEPLAVSVSYDRASDKISIELNNGAGLTVPRRLLQGLENLSATILDNVEILSEGTIIGWVDADVEFIVLGLLHGVYGGKRWMSELARRAGSTKSPAKAKAARANGKKGGRPRKTPAQAKAT
ncbi:MAG TPA: DUF2442 domain-containing protein [Verrucomicrobiae bacterium]|jgi:hypothetical protein|nr:DUF2442 domain-containing protein [Verrucomicrobiae bacterium]